MRGKKRRDGVLTMGELAEACHVAPRTAHKWFDSGLIKGYRLPGSPDRRVPAAEALRFLRASGIPVPAWLQERRLLIVVAPAELPWLPELPGWTARREADLFGAGCASALRRPDAVLFDFCCGRAGCVKAAAGLAALEAPPLLACLACDDETNFQELAAAFGLVLPEPSAESLAAFLSGEGGPS